MPYHIDIELEADGAGGLDCAQLTEFYTNGPLFCEETVALTIPVDQIDGVVAGLLRVKEQSQVGEMTQALLRCGSDNG